MKETSKAMRRRWNEDALKQFQWKSIFTGKGIDVGPGDDPLPFPDIEIFDLPQGDANVLHHYFPQDHFDFLHASQCLEHMHNPEEALSNWLKVVKPGGYVVVTVPDWVLYESMIFPSRYNRDHKSSWSMFYTKSNFPIHIYIPSFLERFKDVAKPLLSRLVDTNYDYAVMSTRDQTFKESEGVECWNEFVLRKL